MSLQIYCVRCKEKTDSNDIQEVVMKNGRDATSALCSACGARKFRIGKAPVEA